MTPAPRTLLATGDPNGVGPELAVAAVAARTSAGAPVPLVVGPTGPLRGPSARAGLRLREVPRPAPGDPTPAGMLDVVPVAGDQALTTGTPSAASGAATVATVRRCLELVDDGVGGPIVAAPHSETAVAAAGIAFAGYPALLADLRGRPRDTVFLLLVGGGLRIVHATLHERLADALARLSPDLVVAAAREADTALRRLGVARPRLAVFGVNPHAGEHGLFGADDETVTVPAVAVLRSGGLDVDGPVGADVVLAGEGRARYDGFVAMYHDQGHLPVKLLAGRSASAVAIGAGVVFASVGHGAAFDLAGTGRADAGPVLRALDLVEGVDVGIGAAEVSA